MNISLLLQMAAEAGPDRVSLVCNGRRWTYSELYYAALRAAAMFKACDCAYVALLDESSEAAPIALFGAAIAGIPYVPLNYRLADEDLAALLTRIAPALIIGDDHRASELDPDSGHTRLTRTGFVDQVSGPCREVAEVAETDAEIAAQIFTSGTTSAPKAALLKHANLMAYILGTVEFMSADERDAALVSVPPYHIAGITALMSSIYAMRRIVLLPAFSPEAWLELVTTEKVSNAFLVPTMLQRIVLLLDQDNSVELGSLRSIAYGGGRMPQELIERALELMPNTGFTNAYGLTETSSTIALLGPEDHREAHGSSDPNVRARITSVGKPLPTIELQIRDDNGAVVPAGEIGEIYVRGEQVSGEYRERSALDSEAWFPTRDVGWLDKEGYLFLGGRADDVIVRGGENISPGEIEGVLAAHAAVAESVAVGIPSVEWGEAVGVAITVRTGSEIPSTAELQNLIRERLRSSRVPEKVIVVDALPYNEMGKLLRREVKTLFN
jgi:acyl-CoA synthetase (AMP-forming)/AMP-acid ligase II